MARVQLRHVSKIFRGDKQDVLAVDDVSLDIMDKEFVVLVGPSGCGKSTTLRMVAGLEEISSGEIHIGDRLVNNLPPKDRDIAMVFQNYALYPHMTVYKNMAFGLKLRGVPRDVINTKVLEAARMLGIENLLERKPKALSGGQRQRVAVGRAIVRNPKAFLFDEPLSNLDAKLRVEMRAEIKKLHRRLQTTTIYVTHDQEEAMTLGDRIVVMKDGVIHQCDTPLHVYENPVNRFVAAFVGTPPMNFLPGRIAVSEAAVDGAGFHTVSFDDGLNRFQLPSRFREGVRLLSGDACLGIRPESISFGDAPSQAGDTPKNGSAALRAKVLVIEPMGDRKDVHLEVGSGNLMIARVSAHADVKEGQETLVRLDVNRLHLFEPGESGMNVMCRGNGARPSAA